MISAAERDTQVLAMIEKGPASFIEVAAFFNVTEAAARIWLQRIHRQGRAHIAHYFGTRGLGLQRPYYAFGAGRDARKPMGNPRVNDTALDAVAAIVAQKRHGA